MEFGESSLAVGGAGEGVVVIKLRKGSWVQCSLVPFSGLTRMVRRGIHGMVKRE